jgi:hypothetical protein
MPLRLTPFMFSSVREYSHDGDVSLCRFLQTTITVVFPTLTTHKCVPRCSTPYPLLIVFIRTGTFPPGEIVLRFKPVRAGVLMVIGRDTWAKNTAVNKNVKVYIGAPGSTTAANAGSYVDAATLGTIIQQTRSTYSSFGGTCPVSPHLCR